MIQFNVLINTIDNIKSFVSITEKQPFDVDVSFGKYTVDGKSIMGLFSLDVSKKLNVKCNCSKIDAATYLDGIGRYIVSEVSQM